MRYLFKNRVLCCRSQRANLVHLNWIVLDKQQPPSNANNVTADRLACSQFSLAHSVHHFIKIFFSGRCDHMQKE
jgi:hypothetical protein